MPLSSAMPDTDAPGCRLRSISSRLSAALCSRRRRLACVSCSDMVCTTGLVHTIPGTHDHAIVVIWLAVRQRASRSRLRIGCAMFITKPVRFAGALVQTKPGCCSAQVCGLGSGCSMLLPRAAAVCHEQNPLPNPSLEGTATGKPAWPRGSRCLSSASRPSWLAGARPSAQTLGVLSLRTCRDSPSETGSYRR